MRMITIAAVAALAMTAAACQKPAEKAADSQADAIQAQGEANAEKLEADAKTTEAHAQAAADQTVAQGEATADAMRAAADQTKTNADAHADAVKDEAKH